MEHLEKDNLPLDGNEGKDGENKGDLSDKEKRYLEQLHGREEQAKNAEEKALIASSSLKVLKDPTILKDMDRAKAEKIVKTLYENGHAVSEDLDEILESLEDGDKKPAKKERSEEELFKEFEKRQEAKQADKFLSDYLAKLPTEERKNVEEDFKDMKWNRTLTVDQTKKYLERITSFYLKDSQKDEDFIKASSWNLKSSQWSKPKSSVVNTAKSLGFSEKEMKKLWLI